MTPQLKKYFVYLVFVLIFGVSIGIIYGHKDKIDTDIFELLSFDGTQEERVLMQEMQDNLSKEIVFLSPSAHDILNLPILNEKIKIFEDIFYKIDSSSLYFDALQKLKIATLDRKKFDILLTDPRRFFAQSLQDLLSPFAFNPLGASRDFFNLSGNSSLFSKDMHITPDLSTMLLKVDFEVRTYYFAKARLKQHYSPNDLLKFLSLAQKDNELLFSGGAIYSAVGKSQGNQEGVIIGSLSFSLVLVFVLWIFRNFRIFYFGVVIVFSFLCGLAGSFLFLDRIHILSIVVCTSLAGLVLDFGMHWLGKNLSKPILPQSAFGMRKIFLIVLVVTLGGYGIFLFSPMIFLHQIAIFSIFGLILGSAVGIDYMIFAYNTKLLRAERIFGIILSAFTSLISFGLLCLSDTQAIFAFGLSSTLTMGGCALFASFLAYKNKVS